MFLFLSFLCGVISYINIDPIKSSFFLIFSLLFRMPLMSFSLHIWFSYFVCLLFLSGIFVILVYFSRLSKINLNKSFLYLFCFVLRIFYLSLDYLFNFSFLSLRGFYYRIYWFVFVFILGILIFFMNFSSYYLNFSGGLRKL